MYVSLLPFYSVTVGNQLSSANLDNYTQLLASPEATRSMLNSLELGISTAVFALIAACILSLVALKTRWRGRRYAGIIGTLPIGVPGMVFGVALLITFVSIPGISAAYGTFLPMIVAEVVAFLPLRVRIVSSSIQLEDQLLEASTICGGGKIRTATRVLFPILRPAMLNAAAVIFILSFRELGSVVLLVAPNTSLVPTPDLYILGERHYLAFSVQWPRSIFSCFAFGCCCHRCVCCTVGARRHRPAKVLSCAIVRVSQHCRAAPMSSQAT